MIRSLRSLAYCAAVAGLVLWSFASAHSQTRVVDSCGVLASPLPVGSTGQPLLIDKNGNLCVGSVGSTARLLSAAGTTQDSTLVKATPGCMFGVQGYNAASAVRYLKFYNKATAPTVGTDTPVKTLALPPSAAFAYDWTVCYAFSIGIGFGLTTAAADNSTASVTAADIVGLNVDYN